MIPMPEVLSFGEGGTIPDESLDDRQRQRGGVEPSDSEPLVQRLLQKKQQHHDSAQQRDASPQRLEVHHQPQLQAQQISQTNDVRRGADCPNFEHPVVVHSRRPPRRHPSVPETDIASEFRDLVHEACAPSGSSASAGGSCAMRPRGSIVMFERAARGCWLNPRFDSEILEEQQWLSSFPQTRSRFKIALIYVALTVFFWMIFYIATSEDNWAPYAVGAASCLIVIFGFLVFTWSPFYQKFYLTISVFLVLLLGTLSLLSFEYNARTENPENSDIFYPCSSMNFRGQQREELRTALLQNKTADVYPITSFCISVEFLLLIYTVIPLPLYLCMLFGGVYSILYETLGALFLCESGALIIAAKILLHLCIHLIGIQVFIMSQVRQHATFWSISNSVMARRDLEIEQQLREKMIHSIMPKPYADQIIQLGHLNQDAAPAESGGRPDKQRQYHPNAAFRPFLMNIVENVSILFADIVGFTEMSQNKSAEELVDLLNDLFGRFDDLCVENNCEKIATLGDCYYCVSGCPKPRADHAICCVLMGLDMIQAIREFDEEKNERVDMRVGIHTGHVLCGIVGTMRFKFDVWSDSVRVANKMESTGRPGRVHITERTKDCLNDEFELEDGDPLVIPHEKFANKTKVHKTYFIVETPEVMATDDDDEDRVSPPPSVLPLDALPANQSPQRRRRGVVDGGVSSFEGKKFTGSRDNLDAALESGLVSNQVFPGEPDGAAPPGTAPSGTAPSAGRAPHRWVAPPPANSSVDDIALKERMRKISSPLPGGVAFEKKMAVNGLGAPIETSGGVVSGILRPRSPDNRRRPNGPATAIDEAGVDGAPTTTPEFSALSPPPSGVARNAASGFPRLANSTTSCAAGTDQGRLAKAPSSPLKARASSGSAAPPVGTATVHGLGHALSTPLSNALGDSLTTDAATESPPLTPMSLTAKEEAEISLASDPGWEERKQDSSSQTGRASFRDERASYAGMDNASPKSRRSGVGIGSSSGGGGGGAPYGGGGVLSNRGQRSFKRNSCRRRTLKHSVITQMASQDLTEMTPRELIGRRQSCYFANSQSSVSDAGGGTDVAGGGAGGGASNSNSNIEGSDAGGGGGEAKSSRNAVSASYRPTTGADNDEDGDEDDDGDGVGVFLVPDSSTPNASASVFAQRQKHLEAGDKQLVEVIKEDEAILDYFYNPPVHPFLLRFTDDQVEEEYRQHKLRDSDLVSAAASAAAGSALAASSAVSSSAAAAAAPHSSGVRTLDSPRLNSALDVVISFVVFLLLSVCCFVLFRDENSASSSLAWRIYFVIALLVEILIVTTVIYGVLPSTLRRLPLLRPFRSFSSLFLNWALFNSVGLLMILLPFGCVAVNFDCRRFSCDVGVDHLFCYLTLVALLHFCNFAQLSSLLKSAAASLAGFVLIVLVCHGVCEKTTTTSLRNGSSTFVGCGGGIASSGWSTDARPTTPPPPPFAFNASDARNVSSTSPSTSTANFASDFEFVPNVFLKNSFSYQNVEIVVDVVLLLILVWFINMELEKGYRLSFHGNLQAERDKKDMETQRDQADWLLSNILPKHVSEELKIQSKYFKNHDSVGVIFASIDNFNEIYEEDYQGGKQFLRVLNEIMGDFEMLLAREEFKDEIEKIKTIGETFMAASGLHSKIDPSNPSAANLRHLYRMIEFALELQQSIKAFNQNMIEFDFEFRIGVNIGPVTAGVIGSSKLHYDIWGDTVNIASRMNTTGVKGRVQVSERVKELMSDYYSFESRGKVPVKGVEGGLNTFLLVEKMKALDV